MSKNIQRIQDLRSQYWAFVRESRYSEKVRQEESEQSELEKQESEEERILKETDELLYRVYEALTREVIAHCGVEDIVVLSVGEEVFWEYQDAIVVLKTEQLFREKCGLSMNYTGIRGSVKLCLQGNAQKCGVILADGKRCNLDFPAVLAENERRRKLWAEHLSETAKQVIDECKKHLEAMPYKCYGIPHDVTVFRYNDDWVPSMPLRVGELKVTFNWLSQKQRDELVKKINGQISHGWMTIADHGFGLYMIMSRKPEKEVENPYFDYKDFYSLYDKVTPELRSVFDTVARVLEFPDTMWQVSNLTLINKMIYEFRDGGELSYKPVGHMIHLHAEHLIQSLYESIPGIHVLDMCVWGSGAIPGSLRIGDYFEVVVAIDKTKKDYAEKVRKQLQTELLISHIKKRRVQYIANQIIKQVLDHIESKSFCRDIYFTNTQHTWSVKLAITPDEQMVEQLRLITNEERCNWEVITMPDDDSEFLKRVQKAVLRQSSGFISIDLRLSQYQLHFPK